MSNKNHKMESHLFLGQKFNSIDEFKRIFLVYQKMTGERFAEKEISCKDFFIYYYTCVRHFRIVNANQGTTDNRRYNCPARFYLCRKKVDGQFWIIKKLNLEHIHHKKSEVRNAKVDLASAPKVGVHHQENSKTTNHNPTSEDSVKFGMSQVEVQESESKSTNSVAKEFKSKIPSKVSKRLAEAAKKKENQMNAENGLGKSSKNKKTENSEHSDKKTEYNNGVTELNMPKEDLEEDFKLQIEDEVQEVHDSETESKTKPKSNGSSEKDAQVNDNNVSIKILESEKDKEKDKDKSNKDKDKEKSGMDLNATVILDESQTTIIDLTENAKDTGDVANGEQSLSETNLSYQNMSFGRTLRKISGRRSIGRSDRNASMNSSMFVNTSLMSTLNDEQIESKLAQYRSNLDSSLARLKRKAASDGDQSPKVKRIKSEADSGYSFIPYGFFQSLRRPVQTVSEVKQMNKSDTNESAKSRCVIM